jgi:hypothetical protein
MMHRSTLILFFLIAFLYNTANSQSNNATLTGRVTDESGQPLELVNVSLKDYPIGTSTNRRGEYLLRIPARRGVTVIYSSMGYTQENRDINARPEERIQIDVSMKVSSLEIDEVRVTESGRSRTGLVRIDPRLTNNLPAAGGGIEALIKTLPGVSSNNELSSQYSVRGGNFDENLVYVNDIEIYRPFLIRAGQQEGLSFINSDLVSSVEFSSGGFSAKYGDKMSSVLDIKYRRPTGFKGSATASLLGGNAHIEDLTLKGKLSHITGIRYKTNRYLLGTLDEKGEYNPRFIDVQSQVTWQLTDKLDVSFLGNLSRNSYQFIPQTRETSFGTWNIPLNTTIYFQGNETDNFNTGLAALSMNYHPTDKLNLKFTASAFTTTESENYDITGQYYLNQLERNMSSEEFGDSILNLGVGTFINHARNSLEASVISFSHRGAFDAGKHLLNWGFQAQRENINNRLNEWIYRDSTGYSLPYSGDRVQLFYTLNSRSVLSGYRITGYLQDTWQVPVSSGDLYLNGGIRANYWDFNNELVISPRVSVSYFPDWKSNISFRLATGMYHQPAFFKELIDRQGDINFENRAQRSFQVLLGSDYIFTAWDRPFRLTSEAYYKQMSHLVPYQVDNVRIRYISGQESKGYATGLDMKINGEFVSGIQSWASLSILKTAEDIIGDEYGYIPRPTDQRFNFSLYFQDYLPGNPSWKMHMTAFYGSRLPTGPPKSERWQDTFRMPPYRRVDMGISKILISEGKPFNQKIINRIHDMWVSLEIFNLLNINNTVSYFWVTSNWGDMYAVPNYLTSRKINLKLSVTF